MRAAASAVSFLFLEKLSVQPDDQAGARNRQNNAHEPSSADAEQVPDETAHEAANDPEQHVFPETVLPLELSDFIIAIKPALNALKSLSDVLVVTSSLLYL